MENVREIRCQNVQEFHKLVRIWEALESAKRNGHYAGPTLPDLEAHTGIKEGLDESLARLIGPRNDVGPVRVNFCQEGTAGPYATRFERLKDWKVGFILTLPANCGYTVKIEQ